MASTGTVKARSTIVGTPGGGAVGAGVGRAGCTGAVAGWAAAAPAETALRTIAARNDVYAVMGLSLSVWCP
jgi:hypothetical protein